jgi:glycosyltransferase involved in cell wall biosynthesis
MRILMLAQFYPPTIGGEERHVADLSAELATRGHSVAVATLWHEGCAHFEIDRGVRIHRIRGSMQRLESIFSYKDRQFAPPFPDPEALLALRRIIREERPDIIHAHNWIVHSFTPLKAWSKAKLVMTLHDYSLVCVQKRLMRHGVRCTGPGLMKCLECAADFYGIGKGVPSTLANFTWGEIERHAVDMFLPVSHSVAEQTRLAKRKVAYRIIPNFIPDDIEPPGDDAQALLAQLPEGDFLLYVGDLMPDKGVDVLLQAHAQLNMSQGDKVSQGDRKGAPVQYTNMQMSQISQGDRKGTPVQYTNRELPLVLIGRPVTGYLEHLPPNVLHLGRWPHSAIMQAWGRCAVALIPSICPDACPTVAMEAMAMGRPIVASRIGGLTDILVDGQTGLLVPPGDVQELREAIQCLLDDAGRRQGMGMIAMQRVVTFQAKSVVPRIEEVYREVLYS